MRTGITLLLFISFLSSLLALSSKEADVILIKANTAFEAKAYKEAIDLYESIAKEYSSRQLYNNLGLAYYYNDQLGKSILNMERAKRLAPLNKDVLRNLKLLNENVKMDIVKLPDFFLKSWFRAISILLASGTWLILHLLLFCAAVFLLYGYLINGFDFNMHFYYVRGVILGFFLLSLLFAGFSYNRYVLDHSDHSAIVIDENTPLRMGAEGNSQEVLSLKPGVKLKIEDEISDFLKVKLEDYTEGWVAKESIERI